jgi:hypothetical protein
MAPAAEQEGQQLQVSSSSLVMALCEAQTGLAELQLV